MSTQTPPPILHHPDDTPHDLICVLCVLCGEIPLTPVLTPCNHLFCRVCIVTAIGFKAECPLDRQSLGPDQIEPISGILKRIWEQVKVRCPIDGCEWSGPLGGYISSHATRCRDRFRGGEVDNSTLKKHAAMIASLEEEKVALRERIAKLKVALDEATAVQFDESYSYGRNEVVELTQLVCQYLENKPEGIDQHRIYNCVSICYQDWKRSFTDNPAHYHEDFRMLLNVCATSNWFTSKQLVHIDHWAEEVNATRAEFHANDDDSDDD